MSADTAPAAMPGEEEIALTAKDQKLLEQALMASTENLYDFAEPDAATALATQIMALDWMDRRKWTVDSQANRHGEIQQMVDAAIAPILAEKERLKVEKQGAIDRGLMVFEAKNEWRDRALAAEAALAAERERVTQVLEPFDDALGEDDEGYGDGLTVVMKWGACTDYSVTLADLRDVRKLAAAIRAQGE